MVTSCRSRCSRACRWTHDTTVATKVGSRLNQFRWKPSLQIYHGRRCRQNGVNGVSVSMELDTGAVVSVMLQQQQKKLFSTIQLQPSKVILRTYTAQSVGVVRTLPVKVVHEEQEKDLSLVILQGKGPALFGLDWLTSIKLKWPSIGYHSVGGMNREELL